MVSYLKKTKFSLLVRSWQNVELRPELVNGHREATLQKGLTWKKKKKRMAYANSQTGKQETIFFCFG